jgi:hypothetical protein
MGATGHCGGTPHSCGSGPAQFGVLPDKSGVPAETVRLDFLQYQAAPAFDLTAKSSNNSAKDIWRFGRRIRYIS